MDQVLEALIVSLAENGIGSDWKVTQEQDELGISQELVYMAGLTLHGQEDVTPPYPSALQEQFQRLYTQWNQQQRNEKMEQGIVAFHLSPRLRPSKEQAAIINEDIKTMLSQLESRANQVLLDLLNEHETATHGYTKTKNKNNSSTRKKRVKKSRKVAKGTTEGTETIKLTSTSPSETLEQILARKIPKHDCSSDALMNSDGTENAWVTIPAKKMKATALHAPPRLDKRLDNSDVTDFSEKAMLPQDSETSSTITEFSVLALERHQSDDAGSNCLSNDSYLKAAQQGHSPATSAIVSSPQETNGSNNDFGISSTSQSTPVSELLAQIAELKRQLAFKDHQLQSERQKHAKVLRQQKESNDNLTQALQLRLYISDTRLKTYQDALEEHLQAVAKNSHYPTSPARGLRHHDGDPPTSPLISRVLIQQNRLLGE